MKIRGNTVGTPIKPKQVLVKSENLTPEEQAQVRQNIGAVTSSEVKEMIKSAGNSSEKAYLYTSFPAAVADLNASTTNNADATEANAVCAICTDSDGNTCLTLLADIELTGIIAISVPVIFKLNGHTVSINGDYNLEFTGNGCVVDGRTAGSQVIKVTDVITVASCIRVKGANFKLLGGYYHLTSPTTTKHAAFIVSSGDSLVIDGAKINVESTSGTDYAYCVLTTKAFEIFNSTVECSSAEGRSFGIMDQSKTGTLIVKNCKVYSCSTSINTAERSYGIGCYQAIIENTQIKSVGEYVVTYGIFTTGGAEVKNCDVYTESIHGGGCAIYAQAGTSLLENSTFFSDGTTGSVSEGNENYAGTQGVMNDGTMTIKNCTCFGTHTGVQCSEGSNTTIDGGLYEGVGHGGLYVACDNGGKFFAENATFRNATYRGKFKSEFFYGNGLYAVAAVYVGCGSGIKAYFDNCIIDGERNEPIALRVSNGEGSNSVYISNCTIMGDGNIRFGGLSHTLYTGFCNRILSEANYPERIIDDGRKVYLGYEEFRTV